ncbi:hypothetical protein JQ615_34750 [Bradyrhizobium jicamae]|uniref:DUF4142 domain-containing protein n=1 Tax=Bradyrhizobium jicamae TaxID=280332 RepID=A0ABS5FW98_9BRAD|nr:hypothetical protein [Bradyrhizobium jicamae]MBR0800536.1 hypothetical protein [Bradyrhizobium jicamae]
MLSPTFGFFRLDKMQEARHLALARAAVALGRKVLTDNPEPHVSTIPHRETNKPSSPQPDDSRMRLAIERKTTAARERRSIERQHLFVADTHVARAERIIRDQTAIIEDLRRDGHETKLAEETMRVYEANLQVMREHRELILRAIGESDR